MAPLRPRFARLWVHLVALRSGDHGGPANRSPGRNRGLNHQPRESTNAGAIPTVGLLSGCLGSTGGHATPAAKSTTAPTTNTPGSNVTSPGATPDATSTSITSATASVSTLGAGSSVTSPGVTPDTTTPPSPTAGTPPPPSPTAGTASNTAPAHAQGKFAGVPAQCPSPDDITLAVHVSIPHVYQTDVSGALDCTYYADGSAGSPGVHILIAALPSGTTVASWEAGTKNANSSAVFVPGVGDAAFYFTTGAPSGLNFISGGVACNMYTGNFTADQAHLVALAESILEG
jgi:hypothetical protein